MGHLDRMLEWCIRKGREGGQHRGLRETAPDRALAKGHLGKAEHYLDATLYLADGGFGDIAVTQAFYAMYHSFLAILAQHGYESRNQACTFAAVDALIEEGRLKLDPGWVRKVAARGMGPAAGEGAVSLREEFQYGVRTRIDGKKLDSVIAEARGLLEAVKVLLAG